VQLPKPNISIAGLKSQYLALPKIFGWLHHCYVWIMDLTFHESKYSTSETVHQVFNVSLKLLSALPQQLT